MWVSWLRKRIEFLLYISHYLYDNSYFRLYLSLSLSRAHKAVHNRHLDLSSAISSTSSIVLPPPSSLTSSFTVLGQVFPLDEIFAQKPACQLVKGENTPCKRANEDNTTRAYTAADKSHDDDEHVPRKKWMCKRGFIVLFYVFVLQEIYGRTVVVPVLRPRWRSYLGQWTGHQRRPTPVVT